MDESYNGKNRIKVNNYQVEISSFYDTINLNKYTDLKVAGQDSGLGKGRRRYNLKFSLNKFSILLLSHTH